MKSTLALFQQSVLEENEQSFVALQFSWLTSQYQYQNRQRNSSGKEEMQDNKT
jgi:hypothetical protein